jgi:hypothetical protein
MWHSALTIAGKAISNKHYYSNVIEESKPTEKVPIKGQKAESFDNHPPSETQKPRKMSRESAGREASPGEG